MNEYRRHTRTSLTVPAKLLISDEEERECAVLDVSIDGIALLVTRCITRGAQCMTSFDVDLRGVQRRINALGEAIYANKLDDVQFRVGIKFIDMDGYSELLLRELTAE